MSIAALGTTPSTLPPTAATPIVAGSGPFALRLQSLLANPPAPAPGATQNAALTEPGRGTPGTARHHHHHGPSNATPDTNDAADSQSTATQDATSNAVTAAGSTRRQTSGGVLLTDMMRGLQAYGATTAVA